jgi:hypothetical protein
VLLLPVLCADTIYIGRYLVCGSDSASLYLEVLAVNDQDILCEAKNGAVMDGLMTVRGWWGGDLYGAVAALAKQSGSRSAIALHSAMLHPRKPLIQPAMALTSWL